MRAGQHSGATAPSRAKAESERAEYEDNLDHRQPGMGATRRLFLFIPKMWVAATPVVVRHLGDDPRLAPCC